MRGNYLPVLQNDETGKFAEKILPRCQFVRGTLEEVDD
jgi:hypothetical protein